MRATFYLHFRNKGELVQHLMKTVERELRAAAAQSLSKIDHFGRAEFKVFMRRAVDIHFLHRAAIRAMVEVSAYDSDVSRVYQEFMARQASDRRQRPISRKFWPGPPSGVSPRCSRMTTLDQGGMSLPTCLPIWSGAR